ncbi:MAG: ATP-binding protein [Pikeienuella sp.]|uniref:ATP-binding protein n=1 Tax=Pikeienuella sp. TaxID=2831957 RepID=UPI00391DFCAD
MIYRFSCFEFDTERRELLRAGARAAIQPRAMDLLAYLLRNADRVVTKRELLDAFWPPNVSEAALQTTMSHLRRVLGAEGRGAIRTHHGLGFRFAGDVSVAEGAEEGGAEPASAALIVRERRLVAALCVKVEGGASDESGLAAFLAEARRIVERQEGALSRMLLDGFTATFGLAPSLEDGARRALYCAAALQDAAPGGAASLRFGVDVGAMTLSEADEGDVWAPPTGLERGAAALAGGAEPGRILVSEAARLQLGDEAECAPAPMGHVVLSRPRPRAGIPARPFKRITAFVGRGAEIAFLSAALERMLGGGGRAVALSGPAGIGKSRLVAEFAAGLPAQGVRSVIVNCLPGLVNSPLAPVRALCLALNPAGPPLVAADAADEALLHELFSDAATTAAALQALSDRERRRRSAVLVERILERATADGPLVVVFEDTHWIDASSRSCLSRLVARGEPWRLLLVLTTRPTAAPDLCEAILHLPTLDREDSLRLLRESAAGAAFDGAAEDAMLRRAAGNPFCIEELALAAQAGADPARNLPDSVQAVSAARIGALPPGLRAAAFVAAVMGERVTPAFAGPVLGREAAETARDFEHLAQAGFLTDDGEGFGFRHILIQEAAYAMIADADRRALHAEIARRLEAAQTRPETLAWHHQEAGDAARAVQCWSAACRAAIGRSAHREAAAFAAAGLALIDAGDPGMAAAELRLRLAQTLALIALRGFGAAEVGESLDRARALNRTVGSADASVRIGVGLWVHSWVRGELEASRAHAGRLLRMAGKAKSAALSLQAHSAMGSVLIHLGRLEEGLGHLETGLGFLGGWAPDSAPAQNAAVTCAAYAAWGASLVGRSEEAASFRRSAEALAAASPNPFAEAIGAALCAEHLLFEDDPEGCLRLAERTARLGEEHGFAFWLGTGLVLGGWAKSRLGDADEALGGIERGLEIFAATGAGVQMANWRGLQAEALLSAGRHEAGLAAAGEALERAETTGDRFFAPRVHATAALLERGLGAVDRARAHEREGAALAARFGMSARMLRAPSAALTRPVVGAARRE